MGIITTPFGRKITVNHSLGATYLYIENTNTDESISTRLEDEQAKQLADMLLDAAEPQKFYLKLFDSTYGYVNKLRNIECATGQYMSSTDREGTSSWQTQFTQEEIDSDPELKKFEAFKIPVEDAE